jgi:hypothetical protein
MSARTWRDQLDRHAAAKGEIKASPASTREGHLPSPMPDPQTAPGIVPAGHCMSVYGRASYPSAQPGGAAGQEQVFHEPAATW